MAERIVIGVDVDDTSIELVPTWLEIHKSKTGEALVPEDLASWEFQKHSAHGDKIYESLSEPSLYDYIQPVSGAKDGLKLLRANYRVVFITADERPSLKAKRNCLFRNGLLPRDQERELFMMPDKSLAKVALLIDDKAETIQNFPGPAILFDRPWNRSWTTPKNREWPVVRCAHWAIIPSFVDVLLDYTKLCQTK